jgi:hypothetical protein
MLAPQSPGNPIGLAVSNPLHAKLHAGAGAAAAVSPASSPPPRARASAPLPPALAEAARLHQRLRLEEQVAARTEAEVELAVYDGEEKLLALEVGVRARTLACVPAAHLSACPWF